VEDRNSIRKQLQVLCIEMLKILEELKTRGVITSEEYHKHTCLKKRFLTEYFDN